MKKKNDYKFKKSLTGLKKIKSNIFQRLNVLDHTFWLKTIHLINRNLYRMMIYKMKI